MTGPLVLLGISAADEDAAAAVPGGLAVGGFFLGVLVSRQSRRLVRGPSISFIVAASTVAVVALGKPSDALAVSPLAFAMGLQNVAATRFAGVSINTAFLTGNIERLGETLAERPSSVNDLTQAARILLIGSVLAAYAVGAATGAEATRSLGRPLLVPAALLMPVTFATFRMGEGGNR